MVQNMSSLQNIKSKSCFVKIKKTSKIFLHVIDACIISRSWTRKIPNGKPLYKFLFHLGKEQQIPMQSYSKTQRPIVKTVSIIDDYTKLYIMCLNYWNIVAVLQNPLIFLLKIWYAGGPTSLTQALACLGGLIWKLLSLKRSLMLPNYPSFGLFAGPG